MMVRIAGTFFDLPVLGWLGQVSYSIYLAHIATLYVVFHDVTHLVPSLRSWEFIAVALPLKLGITFPLSRLTYQFVELSAIRWARLRFCARGEINFALGSKQQ